MAAHKVAHATLTGPSVVKEILIGISLGLVAGGLWKMHHWNEQRKTRAFYDLLEKVQFIASGPENFVDAWIAVSCVSMVHYYLLFEGKQL
ncbi:hypothetical protein RHSIM_Rhsim01G0291000 [Rhododendron simsii]|uniref:Cytochrome c oxidase subunit 5C n=1 Tax=Rhododendron simsii TaxID=118357 RepID=A0A834HJL1_RHOSS|nr:hypothetical protein RHSIM_Rhsim01G0291000 [Rhododendron simsii]